MMNTQNVIPNMVSNPGRNNPPAENHISKPANELSDSGSTSIDGGAVVVGEDGDSCHGEKNRLDRETDHHLKNHEVGIVVREEENALNVSDKHLEEDEVPPAARSEHICLVCRRHFKSMKSLAGHMRCHPERDWRGLRPPKSAPKNSNSSASSAALRSSGAASGSSEQKMDDQNYSTAKMESLASDQKQPLLNWPAKRSRRYAAAAATPVPNCSEDMNADELEATSSFALLSQGDLVEQEQGRRGMDLNVEKSPQEQENTSGSEFRPEPAETDDDGTRIIQKYEGMDCDENQMQMIPCSTEIRKKRKFQDMKSVDAKGSCVSSISYMCTICNKSFSSHQALGGHMAGHKKSPMIAAKVGEISVADDNDDRYEGLDAAHSKPLSESDVACSKAERTHRCKICNETFSSGQALGGHQRRHWSGGVKAPTTSVRLQEDENRAAPTTSVRLLEDENRAAAPTTSVVLQEDGNRASPTTLVRLQENENRVAPRAPLRLEEDENRADPQVLNLDLNEPPMDLELRL